MLIVSPLVQSGKFHFAQSWFFLSYGKKGTPKCSLAYNSQGEGFKLLEPCQLTACRIFQQQLNSRLLNESLLSLLLPHNLQGQLDLEFLGYPPHPCAIFFVIARQWRPAQDLMKREVFLSFEQARHQ